MFKPVMLASVVSLATVLGARAATMALLSDPFCCPCSEAVFSVDNGGGSISSDCAQQTSCTGGVSPQCKYDQQPASPNKPGTRDCYCTRVGSGKDPCCYLHAEYLSGSWVTSCSGTCHVSYCPTGCGCDDVRWSTPEGVEKTQCQCL